MAIPREQRFNADRPCPGCGHGRRNQYCYELADRTGFWCGRASHYQSKPGKPWKGGWIHRLADRQMRAAHPKPKEPPPPARDFANLASTWASTITSAMLAKIAAELGVASHSLDRLGTGWANATQILATNTKCRSSGVWTFPMRDGRGRIVGVRLRAPDGFKYSVDRSDGSGLFIPQSIRRSVHLLLPEGPTSAAAMLSLGFNAIGRPNAWAGEQYIVDVVKTLSPTVIVIVADNDKLDRQGRRAGIDGAIQLMQSLRRRGMFAAILSPPPGHKDARDWIRAGATAHDVFQAIQNATRRDRAAG